MTIYRLTINNCRSPAAPPSFDGRPDCPPRAISAGTRKGPGLTSPVALEEHQGAVEEPAPGHRGPRRGARPPQLGAAANQGEAWPRHRRKAASGEHVAGRLAARSPWTAPQRTHYPVNARHAAQRSFGLPSVTLHGCGRCRETPNLRKKLDECLPCTSTRKPRTFLLRPAPDPLQELPVGASGTPCRVA